MYKSDKQDGNEKDKNKNNNVVFRCLSESRVNVCEKDREQVCEKVKFRS